MQRAPINSLDRVKSAWEVDEGGRGMMASSLVLLFSRSIEVGEKLGVGGSMLSHISPLMFSQKVLCFSCSLALGKPPKQIFGKSWDFGPTGLPPPPSPNVGIPKKEKKK